MSDLTDLFTSIANSIRTKKGTSNAITATDFPIEIASIETGSSPNLQSKSITITDNTVTNLSPDTGYDGFDSVVITTLVEGDSFTINNASYLFNNGARLDIMQNLLPLCNNITSTSYMFANCNSLSTLDLSSLDTSNVTDMSYMFKGIKTSVAGTGLSSLTLGNNFNTNNVTNMAGMFYEVFTNTINLSFLNSFNTSKVTNMASMLRGNGFTAINISNFDTSNVTDISQLLYGCANLTSVTLGTLDCGKVINIDNILPTSPTFSNGFSGTFKDLGKGYVSNTANYSKYKLILTNTGFNHDNLLAIINGLYDLNITYNVSGGGTLRTQALQLGNTNLAKLTAEEIAIATNKGWTVS